RHLRRRHLRRRHLRHRWRFRNLTHELVAAPSSGADEPLRVPVVADRLPSRLDPAGQCGFGDKPVSPYDVEQFFLRYDPVPFPNEHREDVKYLRLDRLELPRSEEHT